MASTPASSAVLYGNDFDSPEIVAPGVSVSGLTNGGLDSAVTYGSWSGKYFRSTSDPATPSVLTLNDLPAHTAIKIDFILGFLESWDSTNGVVSPDLWKIVVDGSPVLQDLTTNNASGTVKNFGGGTVLAEYVQANTTLFFSDTLIDLNSSPSLSFAHTASTLSLAISVYGAGWQYPPDEA